MLLLLPLVLLPVPFGQLYVTNNRFLRRRRHLRGQQNICCVVSPGMEPFRFCGLPDGKFPFRRDCDAREARPRPAARPPPPPANANAQLPTLTDPPSPTTMLTPRSTNLSTLHPHPNATARNTNALRSRSRSASASATMGLTTPAAPRHVASFPLRKRPHRDARCHVTSWRPHTLRMHPRRV